METMYFPLLPFVLGWALALNPMPVESSTNYKKLTHDEYMESKVKEGQQACKATIVGTAKNPDSVKFLDDGAYRFGFRLSRNDIYYQFSIMAMNTYGAVLRHTVYCTATCKEKNGCGTPQITE